jgi:DNA-binding CsgD family transcriptional regulator
MKSTNKIFYFINTDFFRCCCFFLQYYCASRLSQQQIIHQAWITPGTLNTERRKKTTCLLEFFISIKIIFTHPSNVKRMFTHTVQLQILFLAIHTAIGGIKQLKIINKNFAQASPMIRQVGNRRKITSNRVFSSSFSVWQDRDYESTRLTTNRKDSPHWWNWKNIINKLCFFLFFDYFQACVYRCFESRTSKKQKK